MAAVTEFMTIPPRIMDKIESAIVALSVLYVVIDWAVIPRIREKLHAKWYGKELDEPFTAEVYLDDKLVAHLSDREFTEMFWRDYRIEPASPEGKVLIENDSLWETGRFHFRDPATGDLCKCGFVGRSSPFIRDGKISLRALYFGGTRNDQNACPRDCR